MVVRLGAFSILFDFQGIDPVKGEYSGEGDSHLVLSFSLYPFTDCARLAVR
jgi:hypothetical protein